MRRPAWERVRRTVAAVAVLALLLALGCGPIRHLVSGKLDASNGYDFSCSVVNKSPSDTVEVTMALKDGGGNVYVDASTFQPAMRTQEIGPREAAMLVAPAAFVGVTSLYCWADVPTDSTVFGTFLVRDALDRSTAATPLQEDEGQAGDRLADEIQDIEDAVDQLTELAGPVTGGQRIESCLDDFQFGPEATMELTSGSCPSGRMVLGGGCEVSGAGGDPSFVSFFENDAAALSWRCAFRNNATWTEAVNLCVYAVCADEFGGD